ncbi:MAG: hypothetical protein LBJ94_01965 [Puniceicoccales bacterium]|jgi:DNA polymerase-3 subunit epsilon|nr:hypothetical protein [Puniceicoccales bacterium]
MSRLHVIDFEGTRASGIGEYGAATLIDGEIGEVYAAECAENFTEHLDLFIKLRRSGAFAGHNASVEDGLLRHYAASPGFVKKYSGAVEFVITWGPWIDTKVLYKTFYCSLSDYSLENLIKTFALTERLLSLASKFCPPSKLGYHSALFDALATCILLKNLTMELQRNGIETSEEFLLEYSCPGKKI